MHAQTRGKPLKQWAIEFYTRITKNYETTSQGGNPLELPRCEDLVFKYFIVVRPLAKAL